MTKTAPCHFSAELKECRAATCPQVMPGLSLRKNFTWTLAGNVIYAGCQWGMLVVLAKLGTPEMVGQFALGLAVTAPIMMFAYLGLSNVQATDARSDYLFRHYFSLRTITVGLALLIIAGIAFWGGYRQETSLVILTVAIAKGIESFSDVVYGLLQRHEKMDRIGISMIIKGILSPAALGLGVFFTGTVLGGVIGLAVTWALVFFLYDLRGSENILRDSPHAKNGATLVKGLYLSYDFKKLYALVCLALPLGTVALLWSLKVNIPRYFIEHYFGEHELGIFAALAYLMVAGRTVVSALAQTSIPRLGKYYAFGNTSAFRSLILRQIGFGLLLGGGGLLLTYGAGRQLLTLFYGPEYARHADVLSWLMLAAAFNFMATFLLSGLTGARYFRVQTLLHALAIITTTVTCYLLIPKCGLIGAALALVVAGISAVAASAPFLVHAVKKLSNRAHVR